jgi:hypothetical protein
MTGDSRCVSSLQSSRVFMPEQKCSPCTTNDCLTVDRVYSWARSKLEIEAQHHANGMDVDEVVAAGIATVQ